MCATGGRMAAWRGDGAGGFQRMTNAVLERPLKRDATTLLFFNQTIIAGSANYEDGSTNGGAIRLVDLGRNVSGDAVLRQGSSTGPMALADVDGDGAPEIFIGGRVVAGRYPEIGRAHV